MSSRTLALSRLIVAAVVAAACSSAPGDPVDAGAQATTCVRSDPSCGNDPPSYMTTVHPILEAACVTCHYPGSNLAESSLATYEAVQGVSGAALGQVESCLMPPPGAPMLTDAQRNAVLAWLVCGAPAN